MNQKFIDVKVVTWERWLLDDEADVNKIIEDYKEHKNIELAVGNSFVESETFHETTSFLTPAQNNGFSTVEVYDTRINTRAIYKNSNKEQT